MSHLEWGKIGNHYYFESLPLLFLNLILEHTASVDCVIFTREKQALTYLSEQLEGSAFWLLVLSLILCLFGCFCFSFCFFVCFSSKCFVFTLYIFIWLVGSRKSVRILKAVLCGMASQRQDKSEFFAGFFIPRPWYQLTSDGDLLLDSKEISPVRLHRKDEKPSWISIAPSPS